MRRAGASRQRMRAVAGAAAAVVLLSGCGGTDTATEDTPITRIGLPSPHVHGVAVDPADESVYLATHDGLFRYGTGGPVRVGPVIDLMGFTVAGPNHFYASGHPGIGTDLPDPVGLLESLDAGQTWSSISREGQSDFHALTASAEGVTGFDGELLRSVDGVNWSELAVPGPVSSLVAAPDGSVVLAATESGLMRSVDGVRTWTPVTGSPGLAVLGGAATSMVGVSGAGAVYVSGDGGATWEQRGHTGVAQAVGVAQAPGGELRIFVVTANDLVVSTDGGRTFTSVR